MTSLLRELECVQGVHFVWFLKTVSLCSPGWPQTQDPLDFSSQELGLQACTTTSSLDYSSVKSPDHFLSLQKRNVNVPIASLELVLPNNREPSKDSHEIPKPNF